MQYKIACHSTESWLTVIWCLLLVFTASMAIKEIFQLLQAPISYIMSSENWGQWLLIASVLIAAWPQVKKKLVNLELFMGSETTGLILVRIC